MLQGVIRKTLVQFIGKPWLESSENQDWNIRKTGLGYSENSYPQVNEGGAIASRADVESFGDIQGGLSLQFLILAGWRWAEFFRTE